MENIKGSNNIKELIYSLEPLCYYFSMKPQEFWESTYREIDKFTQANLCRIMDDFRHQIQLQEAVSNKLIMADAMSNEKPKTISLIETFQNLFPKKSKINKKR